jgi:hypothetical protein
MADLSHPSDPARDLATRASHVALAAAYAHGMVSGSAAATAESPYFLGNHDLIAAAWEASCAQSDMQPAQPVAEQEEQEEYFVAWVHGYVVRAEQIEGAPPSWEDAAEGNDPSSPIVTEPTTP